MRNLRRLFSMGSAKVRNALDHVFFLVTLMIHTVAACPQEESVDKAALSS